MMGGSAPGLLALAQAMHQLGEIKILAPDHNWYGSGHVYRYIIRWITFENALKKLELIAYIGIKGIGKEQLSVNNMVTIQLPFLNQSLVER